MHLLETLGVSPVSSEMDLTTLMKTLEKVSSVPDIEAVTVSFDITAEESLVPNVSDPWSQYKSLALDDELLAKAPRKMFTLLIHYLTKILITPQSCMDYYSSILQDMTMIGLVPSDLEWKLVTVSFYRCGLLGQPHELVRLMKQWHGLIKRKALLGLLNELINVFIQRKDDQGLIKLLDVLRLPEAGRLVSQALKSCQDVNFALDLFDHLTKLSGIQLDLIPMLDLVERSVPKDKSVDKGGRHNNQALSTQNVEKSKVARLVYSASLSSQTVETIERLMELCLRFGLLEAGHAVWMAHKDWKNNRDPVCQGPISICPIRVHGPRKTTTLEFVASTAATATPTRKLYRAYLSLLLLKKHDRLADCIFKRLPVTLPGSFRNPRIKAGPSEKMRMKSSMNHYLDFLGIMGKYKRYDLASKYIQTLEQWQVRIDPSYLTSSIWKGCSHRFVKRILYHLKA